MQHACLRENKNDLDDSEGWHFHHGAGGRPPSSAVAAVADAPPRFRYRSGPRWTLGSRLSAAAPIGQTAAVDPFLTACLRQRP